MELRAGECGALSSCSSGAASFVPSSMATASVILEHALIGKLLPVVIVDVKLR